MGLDPMTLVANSVNHHDQSIDLGIHDSNTALCPDWDEAVFRHAGNTYVIMFVEEHSLRLLAGHLSKSWCKYYLSDIAEKCMYHQLVTNGTTPRFYGKVMLVVAFDSSMKIIMIP